LNKAASSQSSKRQKASTNSKRSSESSDSSGSSNDDDNDHHITSNGKGMDLTLRQDAIVKKFPTLTYVDVIVFSRLNLNVRKSKRLVPISSSAEFNAAWSSLNVELQQYLINADRSDDALMVTKYYGQIVRLLTDYSSQWQLVMELDGYIRGNPPTVGGRTVWSVDQDDDLVSQFKYDIRANHQDAFRANAALSNQRGAASQQRRAGAAGSGSNNASNKHLLSCSIPLSRRASLYFASPSSVLPRETYTFNVEHVMAQRLSMLADASDAQKQLINVGNSVSRANFLFKQDVWSTLLVDYVPSDSCYSTEVLVAGMKYGSLVRYEGDRTESVSKQNHPDARKHPHELLQLVLQELQLGRVIGPFSLQSPPFHCVKICPLNIVPKGEKK